MSNQSLHIISLIILAIISISCSSKPKQDANYLNRMCYLDFNEKKCWINEAENKFITFQDMQWANNACNTTDDDTLECFYAISSDDMTELFELIYFKTHSCK